MSSGSSGRYQSKFFNFVNQQSRRLTQNWDSTFRHLKVATQWGVQALLSPLYLFWQTANSSVKKLDTQAPPTQPTLQPHDHVATEEKTQVLSEINHILAKLTGDDNQSIPIVGQDIKRNVLQPGRIVAVLDAAIAQLEKTAIVPAQHRSQKIIQVAQVQINTFLYGKKQLDISVELVSKTENLATRKLNISALIAAAVNYFFGVGPAQLIDPNVSAQKLPHNLTDNSWLDWQDLYGESDNIAEAIIPASVKKLNSSSNQKKTSLVQPKSEVNLGQNKTTDNRTQLHKTFTKLTTPKQTQAYSQQQSYQTPRAETQPDWIETSATLLGYEKHILEQALEWLDRAILWLEQILANIFCFLQGLLRGK